jgi:hypothetical protein
MLDRHEADLIGFIRPFPLEHATHAAGDQAQAPGRGGTGSATG